MEQAIINILNNSQATQTEAQRGYKVVLKPDNSEQYVETLAQRLIQV